MSASFQKGCESIATRFSKKTKNPVKAKSLDWMSLITQIAGILIPLFQECATNRSPAEVAASIKQRPFIARRRLRQGVLNEAQFTTGRIRSRINFLRDSDDLIDAVMEEADETSVEELASAIEDAVEPV